jgi:hypothetical protein
MSRPRVGWTATSRSVRPQLAARMTFCWLPPERLRTSCTPPPAAYVVFFLHLS